MPKLISPPHPGETILEDVFKPLGLSVNRLAKDLGITAARLNEIVRGERGITADTALRLARYLGMSAEFWLGLQLEYDLRVARQAKQKDIERAVQPRGNHPCGAIK
jgi:addiction module HigA family antidote